MHHAHLRPLLFCCALLLAPAVFALGDHFAGTPGAILATLVLVLAPFVGARFARPAAAHAAPPTPTGTETRRPGAPAGESQVSS